MHEFPIVSMSEEHARADLVSQKIKLNFSAKKQMIVDDGL
jgi:hypothetical protein